MCSEDTGSSPLPCICWTMSMASHFSGPKLTTHIKCQDWCRPSLLTLPTLSVAILSAIHMSLWHVWSLSALLLVFSYSPPLRNLFISFLHPNFSSHHQGLPKNISPNHLLEAGVPHHHCRHFLLGDFQENQIFSKYNENDRKKGSSLDICPKALPYILSPFLNESFKTQPFIFPEEFSARHLISV